MMKYIVPAIVCMSVFATPASAKDTAEGQNAFTRAAKEPLANIATPVANPNKTICYSVVDCRKKGGDLSTVWQMKHSTDYGPKDYPQPCYVQGPDGKYVYVATSCK